MMSQKMKGQFIFTTGLLVVGGMFFLALLLIFGFGLSWFLKNLVGYALFGVAVYLVINTAQTRKTPFTLPEIGGAVLMLAGILLVGSFTGMMAIGVTNNNIDIQVETGGQFDVLTTYDTGAEGDSFEESKFSVTCASPLNNIFGCRFAPGTYRPIKIDICNRDPELPLPPHILLLSVDSDVNLKTGAEINFADEGMPRESDWRADVFITSGDPKSQESWLELLRESISGTGGGVTHTKDEFIVVGSTIPPGECYSDIYDKPIGINEDGDATLFVVAGRGTKVNSQPMLSISLLEMRPSDPIFDNVNSFMDKWGWITPIISTIGLATVGSLFLGPVGAVVGGAIGFVGATDLNQAIQRVAEVFQMDAPRVIYATSGYKFLVAFPLVEILIALGVLGVLAIAGTKLFGMW